MVKVLIIEDQDMARVALSVVLSKNSDIQIADMATDGQEGVDKALALKPDLVIMDIGLPTIDGIEATRLIKEKAPNIRVLMYTSAVLAVSEGTGWLDPAIAKVVLTNIKRTNPAEGRRGEINYKLGKNLYGLTEREMDVLALIVDGLTNPQIADKLCITISTTKTHVHSILQKLYVRTRAKATAMAMKEGLV